MKALVLFADGMEEVEALTPVDLLRRAGVEVTTAAIGATIDVNGSHNIIIKADKLLPEAAGSYDMLVLPGGGVGTERLGASAEVLALIKKQYDSGKYVAAICAAPTILPKAGITGHEMTCYPGMQGAFEPKLYRNEPVVTSGKVITGRSAGAAVDFSLALINALCGEAKMLDVKAKIVY